jgi:hypothetical protein
MKAGMVKWQIRTLYALFRAYLSAQGHSLLPRFPLGYGLRPQPSESGHDFRRAHRSGDACSSVSVTEEYDDARQ